MRSRDNLLTNSPYRGLWEQLFALAPDDPFVYQAIKTWESGIGSREEILLHLAIMLSHHRASLMAIATRAAAYQLPPSFVIQLPPGASLPPVSGNDPIPPTTWHNEGGQDARPDR